MHQRFKILATLLVLVAALSICGDAHTGYAQTSPSPVSSARLTNKDIVGLVKAGLTADIIIAKIQTSACNFDTSPDALKELKSAGVPDDIILAMIKSSRKTIPEGEPAQLNPSQTTAVSNESGARQTPSMTTARRDRNLWIARFTGQPEAAAAIASVQQGDLAVLQQGDLFKEVSSFASHSKQPAGAWLLSAKEISYSGGSTVKRVMFGLGTGRAHIVMAYKLLNPDGNVVWTKKIKSEPSFWSSGGVIGGIQNQGSSTSDQPQKLMDALSKFFASQN